LVLALGLVLAGRRRLDGAGVVSTAGNASASTLGAKALLGGSNEAHSIKLEAGGVRAESEFTSRTARGTAADYTVTETKRSEVTAESYFLRGRYDRVLGQSLVFGGAGWDRNTFAGVRNRYSAVAGYGRSWIDGESGRLETDLGLTYTVQKDVDPAPGADDAFGGWRMSIEGVRRLSATSDLTTAFVLDNNFENTEDLRADWVSSISVSVTSALALKTSLQLLWDNQPALVKAALLTSGGLPTGTDVLTPGSELDSVLTLALVIKL
jgi:putative salt-induced outer membrane protein YdiY